MVVLRKDLTHEKGEAWLFDDLRYFFYITNDGNPRRRRSSCRPMIAATRRT